MCQQWIQFRSHMHDRIQKSSAPTSSVYKMPKSVQTEIFLRTLVVSENADKCEGSTSRSSSTTTIADEIKVQLWERERTWPLSMSLFDAYEDQREFIFNTWTTWPVSHVECKHVSEALGRSRSNSYSVAISGNFSSRRFNRRQHNTNTVADGRFWRHNHFASIMRLKQTCNRDYT